MYQKCVLLIRCDLDFLIKTLQFVTVNLISKSFSMPSIAHLLPLVKSCFLGSGIFLILSISNSNFGALPYFYLIALGSFFSTFALPYGKKFQIFTPIILLAIFFSPNFMVYILCCGMLGLVIPFPSRDAISYFGIFLSLIISSLHDLIPVLILSSTIRVLQDYEVNIK